MINKINKALDQALAIFEYIKETKDCKAQLSAIDLLIKEIKSFEGVTIFTAPNSQYQAFTQIRILCSLSQKIISFMDIMACIEKDLKVFDQDKITLNLLYFEIGHLGLDIYKELDMYFSALSDDDKKRIGKVMNTDQDCYKPQYSKNDALSIMQILKYVNDEELKERISKDMNELFLGYKQFEEVKQQQPPQPDKVSDPHKGLLDALLGRIDLMQELLECDSYISLQNWCKANKHLLYHQPNFQPRRLYKQLDDLGITDKCSNEHGKVKERTFRSWIESKI